LSDHGSLLLYDAKNFTPTAQPRTSPTLHSPAARFNLIDTPTDGCLVTIRVCTLQSRPVAGMTADEHAFVLALLMTD